jgi:hypothetical protein
MPNSCSPKNTRPPERPQHSGENVCLSPPAMPSTTRPRQRGRRTHCNPAAIRVDASGSVRTLPLLLKEAKPYYLDESAEVDNALDVWSWNFGAKDSHDRIGNGLMASNLNHARRAVPRTLPQWAGGHVRGAKPFHQAGLSARDRRRCPSRLSQRASPDLTWYRYPSCDILISYGDI